LAIVAEIAALHTAQVEILDASPGHGCCVRVRFSAADA
jgi:signal transduction histidine kinase